jgi:hypothetical protein
MLNGNGKDIRRVNNSQLVGTISLVVKNKNRYISVGGGIGRGIGKPPTLSYACKNNNCSACAMSDLVCTCSCHNRYRIK